MAGDEEVEVLQTSVQLYGFETTPVPRGTVMVE